ncbi:hypothetical protein QA601_03250 [Chitinispirillales bacterium ANBcel5]|uniref:uridine kinase family protein n=1 Tax=Cellulosispirillum alkaliphilum TaxID=3039283 RepID=UPI002A4EB75E|nr:hypothetical protein [Chitinispirillales bacterium ANBcel5]
MSTSVATFIAQTIIGAFSNTNKPVAFIAVGGPGGTGKSSLSKRINALLSPSIILTLDDYKFPRAKRHTTGLLGAHPKANDCQLIKEHLQALSVGQTIDKPVYNAVTGTADKTVSFTPKRFVIIDGEISTYPQFSSFIDLSIFIDSSLRTQLKTRLLRDTTQRKYSVKKAITTFWQSNVCEFRKFGLSGRDTADLLLFCNHDYTLEVKSFPKKFAMLLNKATPLLPQQNRS